MILRTYECSDCGKFQVINGNELQIVKSSDHNTMVICKNCMKNKYQKIIEFFDIEFDVENKEDNE